MAYDHRGQRVLAQQQFFVALSADHGYSDVVQHQRRKTESTRGNAIELTKSIKRSSIKLRMPSKRETSNNASRALNVPIQKQETSSTHDAAVLHRGTSSKPNNASCLMSFRDYRASTIDSLLVMTLQAGVGRRSIPANSYRLANQALDPTTSGASRFYASVLDAAVASRTRVKKKHAKYRPGLVQITEQFAGNRPTPWQHKQIIVYMALIPISLFVACLVLLFVLDGEAPTVSNVANIMRSMITGNLVWDANFHDLSRIAVFLQMLVPPYIFPTPFGSFQILKSNPNAEKTDT